MRRPRPPRPGPPAVLLALAALGLAAGAAVAAGAPPDLVLPDVALPGARAAPSVAAPATDVALTDVERAVDVGGTAHAGSGPRAGAAPRTSPTWTASIAQATGIPEAAVRAYADATLAAASELPACGLGWTTLAALGAVESGHGSHGGAVLGTDGRPSIPVVGPALDGNGVAAIAATVAGTEMHGDARWEHAVGPLQFLPATWARWGADGDTDGASDPHDLDDAALAAARYLCAGGRDLTTGDGWRAAVLSYNRSEAYVDDVLSRADGYARAAARAGTP